MTRVRWRYSKTMSSQVGANLTSRPRDSGGSYGVANEPPSARKQLLPRGGSSRPMVARLVRYGPVRQKTNFSIMS